MKRFVFLTLFLLSFALLTVNISAAELDVGSRLSSSHPSQAYSVTIYCAPDTASVDFFNCDGFDDDGYDVLGEKLSATDNGALSGYRSYTLTLTKGTYAFRATDESGKSLGGMTFDVPTASGNPETDTLEIYLRRVNVYTTTKIDNSYATESQYTARVIDADGNFATAGKPFVDTNGETKFPYFLCASGNEILYTIKLIPTKEISDSHNVGTNTVINQTISKGTTVMTKSFACRP